MISWRESVSEWFVIYLLLGAICALACRVYVIVAASL